MLRREPPTRHVGDECNTLEQKLTASSGPSWSTVRALASGATGGPGRFVLAVTATEREAEDLTDALRAFVPPQSVALFPGWETLPHERLSPRSDTVGQRIAILRRLTHPERDGDHPVSQLIRRLARDLPGLLEEVVSLVEHRVVEARGDDGAALAMAESVAPVKSKVRLSPATVSVQGILKKVR